MAKVVREISDAIVDFNKIVIGIVEIDKVTSNSKKIHYETDLLGLVVVDNNGNVVTEE
jgi:hypothetical protein